MVTADSWIGRDDCAVTKMVFQERSDPPKCGTSIVFQYSQWMLTPVTDLEAALL